MQIKLVRAQSTHFLEFLKIPQKTLLKSAKFYENWQNFMNQTVKKRLYCYCCQYSTSACIDPDKWKCIHILVFLFLHINICCCYSLEAPWWGTSNEYPYHMFSWRIKKNIGTFWLKKCLKSELMELYTMYELLLVKMCHGKICRQ